MLTVRRISGECRILYKLLNKRFNQYTLTKVASGIPLNTILVSFNTIGLCNGISAGLSGILSTVMKNTIQYH